MIAIRSALSNGSIAHIVKSCVFTTIGLVLIIGQFLPALRSDCRYFGLVSGFSAICSCLWLDVWRKEREYKYWVNISLWCVIAALHAVRSIMEMQQHLRS